MQREIKMKMSFICMKMTCEGAHFHVNGFARRLVRSQRQKEVRKRCITATDIDLRQKLLVLCSH